MYLGDFVRVISGKYKGKIIDGFDIDGTRPTMDRVKESMFGVIQNYVKDSVCLDLFAGSGSLGIEALSNGASVCYFVDSSSNIYSILEKNLNGISNCVLLKKDFKVALDYFKSENNKFDLIFLDPPYKLNLINEVLDIIFKYDLLNDSGIIICEYEDEKVLTEHFKELRTKKYGSKFVTFYIKL